MLKTHALILCCLSLSLISCVSVKAPAKNPKHLTTDCDNPTLEKKSPTYRDAVMLADKRGQALKSCTARMKALRKL